jgi:hypothetical protein
MDRADTGGRVRRGRRSAVLERGPNIWGIRAGVGTRRKGCTQVLERRERRGRLGSVLVAEIEKRLGLIWRVYTSFYIFVFIFIFYIFRIFIHFLNKFFFFKIFNHKFLNNFHIISFNY